MRSPRGVWLVLALALLFFVANRAAYKGWFNDDDLDNLLWTRYAKWETMPLGLLSPKFAEFNFRPTGHAYYQILVNTARLNFPWYIAVLHLLHLLNVTILWRVLRRLGSPVMAASAGALFFAFHMACFDAYWKPMYIFDVLCGTFSLLTLLVYLAGFPFWALIPFWFAYKAKELAVAMPVVLLLYEWLLGERRWRRTIPFFLIAASFTVQGVLLNRNVDNDYSLRFTWDALSKTSQYYLSEVLLVPFAGFLLLVAAAVVRDRRVRFGLLSFLVLLGPLWFLPGRLFSVYLYVPLIGIAIAAAVAAERVHPAWVALFFAFWLPWNYHILRQKRALALAVGVENKAFFEQLGSFLQKYPGLQRVVYDGHPKYLASWGVAASFRWFRPEREFEFYSWTDQAAHENLAKPGTGLVSWQRLSRRLKGYPQADMGGTAEIDFREEAASWQLGPGWYDLDGGFRWTAPRATVRMMRPAGAREFYVLANVGPVQAEKAGGVEPELRINAVSLGKRKAAERGWRELRWALEPGAVEGPVEVELVVDPPFDPGGGDARRLGVAVVALGFRTR